MSTFTVSSDRIALARQRRGLALSTLASLLDVTPRTISRWEKGDACPNEDAIQGLAETLGFPKSFFFAPPVDEVPVESVSFRALSKTSARLRDSAIGAGRIATQISDWLDERFELPGMDVPSFTGYDPELAAESLRERWGLGVTKIPNLVHLLEAHGVRVFSLAMDAREVDAFSFYRRGRPFALVNTSKTAERQRFDLAHELGHLVLHTEHEQVTSSREAELQAQRFAAAFLMPREDVISQPLWHANVNQILSLKKRWGVAAMALTHRLRELGMLSEWGYRDACVLLSKQGFRRSEPFRPLEAETSQVLFKAFQLLRRRGVMGSQLAAEVNLTPWELNTHVFGLAPASISGEGEGGSGRAILRIVGSSA